MRKKLFVFTLLFLLFSGSLFASSMGTVIRYQGSIFDEIYNLFNRQMNMSFRSLRDNIVPLLLLCLIMCELLWLAAQAVMQKSMALSEIFIKFFLVILVVTLTQNLDFIVQGLMKMFSQMAAAAGDSGNLYSGTLSRGEYALFRPSIVISSTESMLTPLESAREYLSNYINSIDIGLFDMGKYFSLVLPGMLAQAALWIVEVILLVMISFVNINVTMWLIEFQFLMVVCMICLPWQIFSPTKFVASGVWQALFGQAIKLFCIVFLVSIAPNLFRNATVQTVNQMLAGLQVGTTGFAYEALLGLVITTIGLTLTYCYFLMKGPAIAKAIIVGQPTMETLGSHAVTRMGASAIGVAGAGFAGAMGLAGRGVGSALGGLINIFRNPQQNPPTTFPGEGGGSDMNSSKIDRASNDTKSSGQEGKS